MVHVDVEPGVGGGAGLCSAPRIGTSHSPPPPLSTRRGAGLCSAPRIGTRTRPAATWPSTRRRRALLGAEDRNGIYVGTALGAGSRRRALLGAEDRNIKYKTIIEVAPGGAGLCSAPRIGTPMTAGRWRRTRSGAGLCSAPRIGTPCATVGSTFGVNGGAGLCSAPRIGTRHRVACRRGAAAAPGFARRRGSEHVDGASRRHRPGCGAGLCSAPRIGTPCATVGSTFGVNGGAGLCSAPRIGTRHRVACRRGAAAAPGFARRRGSEHVDGASRRHRPGCGAGLCSAPRIGTATAGLRALPGTTDLVYFPKKSGASSHCQMGGLAYAHPSIFIWLNHS